jgi:hypothetical protein
MNFAAAKTRIGNVPVPDLPVQQVSNNQPAGTSWLLLVMSPRDEAKAWTNAPLFQEAEAPRRELYSE